MDLISLLQKCFLGFLLAFGISVTLCDADCYVVLNDPLKSPNGCIQDGKLHRFGSTWIKNCYRCDCSRESIGCCSTFVRPDGFDEEKCELIFHKESCSYSVVRKDDPSKTCAYTGMVG
ncbi:beta-microseminoprotein-like [Emydura macquarii macquarii]|uniref:beta-microseminoprotein-like n=1 Tax=Emydura macquarii macquarii TaxID=1129001 RepID=UPI003529F053